MNKTEMAQLLTIASAIDNRKLSPEAVEAWHMVIGDIDIEVAVEAVKQHFDTSTEYLIPNHIRVLATKIVKHREAMERRAKLDAFIEMRDRVLELEWQKVLADPTADRTKLESLSRGEWKDEWATGMEIEK